MKISPDYLVERRKNKIALFRWKICAISLIFIIFFYFNCIENKQLTQTNYIGRMVIDGVIREDYDREQTLSELLDDDNIKALLVHINSPGGCVVGSEILYNRLNAIRNKIPVVAVLNSIATSGAYLAALGTDWIICHNGTITGSIGVIMQNAEITNLLQKTGINYENFRSGNLKALPNLVEKVPEEARQNIMHTISDVHSYFLDQVILRREITSKSKEIIAQGGIFSAKQALNLKLVDQIGDSSDALKWLHEVKKIDVNLPVQDVEQDNDSYLSKITDKFVSAIEKKLLFLTKLQLL